MESTTQDALENNSHVKIALTCINGILRSKYISKKKFQSALKNGFGFCDVVLGSDIDDGLIDGLNITGWHSGYPDGMVNIIENSMRLLPFENNMPLFLAEFTGPHASLCPRQILKKIISRANNLNLTPIAGMEFEFSVFHESPESIREKNYKDLDSLSPGNCGYSMLRTSAYSEFHADLLDTCESMQIPIEGLHTEIGPGVLEAAICKGPMLEVADAASLFKTVVKTIANRHGLTATFMAKWSLQHQGQSGHIHLSLLDLQKNNVFYSPQTPNNMSKEMCSFLAGQHTLMGEFLLLNAPFVNSYTRLTPGYWAPTQGSWGVDNRTCALRVIPGSEQAQRIEYRIPGADCNPYLAMSAALASGLYGLEQELALPKETIGNAYQQKSDFNLPDNINNAATLFRSSKAAVNYFGENFVSDYATSREWEGLQAQKSVTDWQLERYFELA